MRTAAALLLVSFMTGSVASASSTPITDAQSWVALVDAGDYAASWSAAGTIFRNGVTEADWAKAVGTARKPLGAVVSRTLLTEKRSKTLPGAPDGDYDVIQFSTRFANKQAAVETVVVAHEGDSWRVDGYFVR